MIKAVVFDVGGVILDWRTPFHEFLNRFGIELDLALIDCMDIIIAAELGQLSTDELCQNFMAKLGQPQAWQGLRKIMPAGFIPRQDTLGLINSLQGKYRLALLTNAEIGQVEEMDKLWHFKKYFEVIVDSSKLGVRKPDKQIFVNLLNQLALPAEECLFIDDIKANIESAAKLGFATVHFTDPEESVKLIRKTLYGKI